MSKLIVFISIYGVIFNNFRIAGSLLLTDILFTVIAVFMLVESKKTKIKSQAKYIFVYIWITLVIIILNYFYYSNKISALSQLRFLWGGIITFVFIFYYTEKKSKEFLKQYLSFIVIASIFIISQNVTFHLFNYHFFLSFGDYDLLRFSTDGAVPGVHSYIRSGGLFREPSWYAIFAMPSIFMFHKLREKLNLFLVLLGIVISTSSLGYLFILLFIGVLVVLSKSLKLKIYTVLIAIVSFVLLYLVYFEYAFLFDRLIFVLETGGSASIRVLDPLEHLSSNITLFGTDTSFMKSKDEVFFVNTFLYIFFSFGLFGLILFIPLIISLRLKYIYYSIGLLLTIVIEGLAGRVDFWVLIVIILLIRSGAFDEYLRSRDIT